MTAKHLNLTISLKSELRRKILQKYQVTDQEINTPAGKLTMMVVEEPTQLLENFKTDQISTFPYWATLWGSSLGLAYHLATYGDISSASVLDLGCGMGLAGILACQQGARLVFADWVVESLLFAQYNTLRNGYDGTYVQMDWSSSCFLPREFSVILAADILYETDSWQPILTFIKLHLAAGGRAFFSEPGRTNAKNFPACLADAGFHSVRYRYPITFEGRTTKIWVYEAQHNV